STSVLVRISCQSGLSLLDMASTAEQREARLTETVQVIRSKTTFEPEIALILGSGLGPLADEIVTEAVFDYSDLPGFVKSTAPGHAGELHLGTLERRKVVAMTGRFHYYERVAAYDTACPVQVMHGLGARSLVRSHACGGRTPNWNAGELILQLDYINCMFDNPRMGPAQGTERFPVLHDAYDSEYL